MRGADLRSAPAQLVRIALETGSGGLQQIVNGQSPPRRLNPKRNDQEPCRMFAPIDRAMRRPAGWHVGLSAIVDTGACSLIISRDQEAPVLDRHRFRNDAR